MSASSSHVKCHSHVDLVYVETSNNLQMQHECSKFSQTRDIQSTPSSEMVKVELQDSELWRKFHNLTNKMIVNKQGRCMFTVYSVKLYNLKPDAIYNLWMDVVSIDGQRYKPQKNQWTVVGPGKANMHRNSYLHPLSPCSGKTLMGQLVSFNKMKLTNSFSNLSAEKVYIHSQHHYQQFLHISRIDEQSGSQLESTLTFTFDETSFIAVTTYQNDQVSQMKIENNPYARGFRDGGGNDIRKRKFPEIEVQMPSSSQGSNPYESTGKRLKKQSSEVQIPNIGQTEAVITLQTPHLPTYPWTDAPIPPQEHNSFPNKVSVEKTHPPEVIFFQSNPAEQRFGGSIGESPFEIANDTCHSEPRIQTGVQLTSCPQIQGWSRNEHPVSSPHCQQQNNWQSESMFTSASFHDVHDRVTASCNFGPSDEPAVGAPHCASPGLFPEFAFNGSTFRQ